jgi:hypothetical protein
MHNPATAVAGLERLSALFPCEEVTDGWVEPADVLVTGPLFGGPGHAMIVGAMPNTVYHATPAGVVRTGVGFVLMGHRVYRVLRLLGREGWK